MNGEPGEAKVELHLLGPILLSYFETTVALPKLHAAHAPSAAKVKRSGV